LLKKKMKYEKRKKTKAETDFLNPSHITSELQNNPLGDQDG